MRRTPVGLFVGLAVALATACETSPQTNNNNVNNNNNSNANCNATCSVGDTRCASNAVETCQEQVPLCADWVVTQDCSLTSATCTTASGDATCVTGCSDACPASGDQQCSDTIIQTCGPGDSGCLEWIDGTDCADAGQVCDDTGSTPVCACDVIPEAPAGPVPPDGAFVVDVPALTQVSWGAAAGADEYAVYLGTSCPPPDYPDAAYEVVTDPVLSGVTLEYGADYCWSVVSLAAGGCFTAGPVWEFTTADYICPDPVAGPPAVTSGGASYAAGTTTGTYVLTFSEAVSSVAANLTWTPIVGTGTLTGVTVTSPTTAEVSFAGVADGDSYRLTVGTGVVDTCDLPLPAPVNLILSIQTPLGAGDTCATAADASGMALPLTLPGDFAEDPATGGSCDTTPTNAVWFTYTPAADGTYAVTATNQTTATAGSRLAVFEGAACSPLGTEQRCVTSTTTTATTSVTMTAGTTYVILFHTDGDAMPMEDPSLDVVVQTTGPGDLCTAPIDVTAETFPYTATGQFDEDPSNVAPTCDTAVTNAVWFSYTAQATGSHRITAENASMTYAYSRLAVFETTACAPAGTQLACATADDTIIATSVLMTQGESYLLLFYTDGDSYTMVDPTLTIELSVTDPGDLCTDPLDVTGATFPYTATGTFDEDPGIAPTCDTSPTNAVWFTYTPPSTGRFLVSAVNATTTNAYSRLAVFDSAACSPPGTLLACVTNSAKTVSAEADLVQGQPVMIVFFTDGDTYTMVDPALSISPFYAGPGATCAQPEDVSAAAFPHLLTGTFGDDPAAGGSCDTTPTNAVWYSFTPGATDLYDIEVENGTGTGATRVAVFESLSCSPLGAQLACATGASGLGTATASLVAGTRYLILAYTDAATTPMVDPAITIDTHPFRAGEFCASAPELSGQPMPYTFPGTFTDDPATGGTCDTTPNNAVWWRYTPTTSGLHVVTVENQTTTIAYTRLAVFTGDTCSPYGTQVACLSPSSKTVAGQVDLTAGTTYLFMAHTDGESYTMVDPRVTIFLQGSEATTCADAVDVTAATFPVTQPGFFTDDPASGGSCDTTPNNTVWWKYTPATTAVHDVIATSAGSTGGTRLAIFTGDACAPYGAEVSCLTATGRSVSALPTLTAGQTYLLAFYTDGDTYPMVNPSLYVGVHDPAGETCAAPIDLTSKTFPFQKMGTFNDDPAVGGSCDTTPNNVVWYTYTAPATRSYTVSAVNATTTAAFSRLAVFESAACSPYGAQVGCVTSTNKTPSTTVSLTQGVTYLIMFYTDGDTYTMVNPSITIQ